jgi:hypothetical protein
MRKNVERIRNLERAFGSRWRDGPRAIVIHGGLPTVTGRMEAHIGPALVEAMSLETLAEFRVRAEQLALAWGQSPVIVKAPRPHGDGGEAHVRPSMPINDRDDWDWAA